MNRQHTVGVIGAGIVGAAVAHALAREGHRVQLLDREAPGTAGASYGNVGHLAAELVEPLPSYSLLFGFWRQLFAWGGPLHIRGRHVPAFLPWAWRFAKAAHYRRENTRHLAPLVRPAVHAMRACLAEIGRLDLLCQNGHFELLTGAHAPSRATALIESMRQLEVAAQAAPLELIEAVARQGTQGHEPLAGVWFADTGHVVDPLLTVRAFVDAALQHGATFKQLEVCSLAPQSRGVDLRASDRSLTFDTVVVCTGAWAAHLLEPMGLRVPMEAAHGYHVELPGHVPITDAPLVYADEHLVVTPMRGRLRASTFMEFSGLAASVDARKPDLLRRKLNKLGYDCPAEGPSWRGPRPVLPDYLPGIGRVAGTNVFYAVGHQHIGLTLAPVTAELVADLVAARRPRHEVAAFDLARFRL
jgi:D-amino-acid dehydrogenase